MCDERVDAASSGLLQQLGRACDRVGSIGKIVDENGAAISDGADEEEGGVLAIGHLSRAALLHCLSNLLRCVANARTVFDMLLTL